MFTTPLTLSPDSPSDVDTNTVSFVLRFADEAKSVYSVAGLTPPAENKISVSHQVDKDGLKRHLVRLDNSAVDANGIVGTGSVYCVIVQPPHSSFTAAAMRQLTFMLVDLLIEGGAGANIDKLLNSEL